jgi:uncharacterized membrane protein
MGMMPTVIPIGIAKIREEENQLKKTRYLITAAIIAAIYAALTIVMSYSSYGLIQFRVSEILTVLPFFTPAAIPGLFIGCIISNLFSPFALTDIIVGSLATLIAAYLTSKMPNKWLAPLPPVICNAVIVGLELSLTLHQPLWYAILSVGFGEAVVCFVGGYIFILALERIKGRLFGKI